MYMVIKFDKKVISIKIVTYVVFEMTDSSDFRSTTHNFSQNLT